MIVVLLYASGNMAWAGTTTEDFLKWERKSQDSFLHTSITMIGVIAAQTNPKISTCIDEWYLANDDVRKERNGQMLSEMPKLAKFHPSAVILAFVENVCGEFGRN